MLLNAEFKRRHEWVKMCFNIFIKFLLGMQQPLKSLDL